MLYRDLVEDGHIPGLLVHPDWWEPKHPQEIPVEVDDPVALYRPSPEISIEPDYGNPDINYGVTPDAPIIIDDFNRANGDPGTQWVNSGIMTLDPTYYVRPTIVSNALRTGVGTYPAYAISHEDTIPVDHRAEVTLTNVVAGSYFIGIYVWCAAATGTNEAVTESEDTGYYSYMAASPLYGETILAINRWDRDSTYLYGNTITVNNTGTIPDGAVLGIQRVGYDVVGYVRFPDGTYVDTGGSTIISSNSTSAQIANEGQPFTGQNRYFEQQRCGIGVEGYGGISVDIDRFEARGVNTYNGTLINTLNGGETRLALNDAMVLGPFAEWIGIQLDGGGWHMSRLTTGSASQSEGTPVFHVEFNTPFPTGSTATAGNAYYIGGRR